ncbi:glycosyltransferase [Pseudomonas protegens]|uniref:glycosyltransferase n=1 Tax=Pseudomonas protegens TaxID=380021 RepID=UPI00288329FF|nr:glycosyltransferase [Pseudomonas protegens]
MSQESEFFRVPSGAPIFNGEFSSLEAPVSENDQVEQRQRVAILMATYNGTLFLNEQLASIEQQAHQNWALYVSDDGSQDDTVEILEAARQRWGGGVSNGWRGQGKGMLLTFFRLHAVLISMLIFMHGPTRMTSGVPINLKWQWLGSTRYLNIRLLFIVDGLS